MNIAKDISKELVYSPASVIGIFNNALRLPQTVSLIFLKGRYTQGKGKAYAVIATIFCILNPTLPAFPFVYHLYYEPN